MAPTCVPWPLGWKPHFSSTLALTRSGVMMGVKPRETTWGRGGGGLNTHMRRHCAVAGVLDQVGGHDRREAAGNNLGLLPSHIR